MGREGSSIIRWGIPGSIFFLFLFIQIFLVNLIFETCDKNIPLSKLIDIEGFSFRNGTEILAFLIGASIPLGFIIYQIYYWWFWWGLPNSRLNPSRLFEKNEFESTMWKLIYKYELNDLIENEKIYFRNRKFYRIYTYTVMKILNFYRNHYIKVVYKFQKNYSLRYTKNLLNNRLLLRNEFIKFGLKDPHKNQYNWFLLTRILREAKENTEDFSRGYDIFHGLGASYTAVFLSSIFYLSLWAMKYTKIDKNFSGEHIVIILSFVVFVNIFLGLIIRINRGAGIRMMNITLRKVLNNINKKKLIIICKS